MNPSSSPRRAAAEQEAAEIDRQIADQNAGGTSAKSIFKNNKFRWFIGVSIALHFILTACYGVPAYLKFKEEERQAELKKLDELRKKEDVKKEAENARKKAVEETKKDVAKELKKDFEKIVQNDLSKPLKEELWTEVLEDVAGSMEDYSIELGDGEATESDLRNMQGALNREMIKSLNEHLSNNGSRQLARTFLAKVKNDIAPKVAQHYQEQVEKKVGEPIRQDAEKLVRQATDKSNKDKQAALRALQDAKNQADRVANDSRNAGDRISQARKNSETEAAKNPDAAEKKLADKARGEQGALNNVEAALNNVSTGLDKAEAAANTNAETAGKINAARNAVKQAQDSAKAAKESAQNGQSENASKQAADTSDAAKKASAALQATSDAVNKDGNAGETQAKAALKEIADKGLKEALNTAFDTGVKGEALPRVSDALAGSFKAQLETAGMKDEALVEEVKEQVNKILEQAVNGGGQNDKKAEGAANAGAKPLQRGDWLKDAKAPEGADTSEQGKAAKAAVNDLVNKDIAKGMTEIAKDTRADAQFAKMAKDATAGEGNFADLKDRIGYLADSMESGRSGVLGEGDLTELRDGALKHHHGGGDGPELPGSNGEEGGNNGILAAGQGEGAGGERSGQAGNTPDQGQEDGVGAGIISAATGRGLGGPGSGGSGSMAGFGFGHYRHLFDKKAYDETTAVLQNRDKLAAQGQSYDRQGAGGDKSQGERQEEILRPASVIAPKNNSKPAVKNEEPYQPTFKSILFAAIPYAPAGFQLDGDLSDWKDIPSLELKPETDDRSKDVPLGTKVVEILKCKAAWDNTGFYFAFDVPDADDKIRLMKPSLFWEGDGVEIWIDGMNTKEKQRSRSIGQQFWVLPFGSEGNPDQTGGEAIKELRGGYQQKFFGADKIQRSARKTDQGWILECKIPIERIANLDLTAGRIIGLNICVLTGTKTYYYWSCSKRVETYARPDTWGDVLLSGSDAKVEMPERLSSEPRAASNGSAVKSAACLIAGEPLRLRVIDPDMNLSDERLDKVSVSVRTGHGERQVAILQETGPRSGIFEGSLRTALSMGDPVPGTLSVYEGEKIEIVYIDQARANGARNAEVRQTVRVGSVVSDLAQRK